MRAVLLSLGSASALGLARFAFGLLVPSMRESLGWTLADAGTMTTANGLGYLLGAVVAAWICGRIGLSATFRTGMVLIAVSLAANGLFTAFAPQLISRGVAGFAGALVFISGGVIAARTRSARVLTIFFAGTGLGIVLAAVSVPLMPSASWRLAWYGLALAATLATAASWPATHLPTRGDGAGPSVGRAPSTDHPTPPPPHTTNLPARGEAAGAGGVKGSVGVVRRLWAVTVSYVLFGAGYITYLTFLSAFLVERRAGAGEVALTWVLLGVAVLGSPWVWRRVIGRRWTVSVLLVVLAVAALVALAGAATVSAVLFGVTLMQVPAAITARVRDAVPAELLTGAVGTFTVLFAVGQMVGPWPAGVIADLTTPGATLMWTAVLCAAGAVLAPWKPGKPSAW